MKGRGRRGKGVMIPSPQGAQDIPEKHMYHFSKSKISGPEVAAVSEVL